MLALYVRTGPDLGRIALLDPEEERILIGRAQDAVVPLTSEGVSRRHAQLTRKDGTWLLGDLGSANGTLLNALPLKKATPIAARDLITLGPVELLVVDIDPSGPLPVQLAQAGLPPRADLSSTVPAARSLARNILGGSEAVRRMVGTIELVAPLHCTVLIRGETGTGKELVARAIHTCSKRREGPFVVVNCGAIPESLVESEFFGHEAGAFTGAAALRRGYFEEASGGTLFLDEIGDLPLAAQAKLLRALETRSIRRVGGTEEVRTDVRILAATHRDMEKALSERTFREDLYHRLRVVEIVLPPLRERASDIPALARHFLAAIALEMNRHDIGISPEAMALLQGYPWPGNVRELKNAMERAVILSKGQTLQPIHLAFLGHGEAWEQEEGFKPLKVVEEAEAKKHILKALAIAKGNRSKAALLLGIGRQTLYDRMKQYGMDPDQTPG